MNKNKMNELNERMKSSSEMIVMESERIIKKIATDYYDVHFPKASEYIMITAIENILFQVNIGFVNECVLKSFKSPKGSHLQRTLRAIGEAVMMIYIINKGSEESCNDEEINQNADICMYVTPIVHQLTEVIMKDMFIK